MNKALRKEEREKKFALMDIAMTKAWNFGMEYNSATGREQERAGFDYLKEGYIEGFLAGFSHKFGGGND
jgi:hypothetical protein